MQGMGAPIPPVLKTKHSDVLINNGNRSAAANGDAAHTRKSVNPSRARGSRVLAVLAGVCALVGLVTFTNNNTASRTSPGNNIAQRGMTAIVSVGGERGTTTPLPSANDGTTRSDSLILPPSALSERDTEMAADAVAKACVETRAWCGECCVKRASHGGRGPRLDRFRSLLFASGSASRALKVAVVGNSVARVNDFGTARLLVEAMRKAAPNSPGVELHNGEVLGGE
jgi:hypothetical protein